MLALFAVGRALLHARVQANGAFPAVSQLVGDPSDPTHLVLRSNFGLLITHDRGDSWDLVCEAGLGYQNVEPAIAAPRPTARPSRRSRTASLTAARNAPSVWRSAITQLRRGRGTCAGRAGRKPSPSASSIDAGVSQVWRSLDGGQSWDTWGSALNELNATTLDVAGDAQGTLYVSGVSQS